MSNSSKEQESSGERSPDGRFKPGASGNPSGRPKGAQNKVTGSMREMFSEALERLGGVAYLVKFGKEKPELFIGMLARMLPREFKAEIEQRNINLSVNVLDLLRERQKGIKLMEQDFASFDEQAKLESPEKKALAAPDDAGKVGE